MNIKYLIISVLAYLFLDQLIPVDPIKVCSEYAKNKIKNLKYDFLVDVRDSVDLKYGYHVYSINIPLNEIESIKNKVKNKNRKLLIISNKGDRSKKAAIEISKLGYRNVEFINAPWTSII